MLLMFVCLNAVRLISPLYQNSGQYWPNKQFIKMTVFIDIIIGESIDLADRNKKEVIAGVQI